MNKTVFIIALALTFSSLSAQHAGLKTFVIQLKDKGISKDAAVNPSLYLSEKAVERHLKQKIAFDQTDIPVNEQYVNDISKTGAHILTRSRWFNVITIEATVEMMTKISALPFIAKAEQIDNSLSQNKEFKSTKPFFEAESINPWTGETSAKKPLDLYNYGSAYNQINQLKGQYLHNKGYSGQGMTIAVLDAGFNSVNIMPCFDSLRSNHQIKGTRDFAQPGNNVYGTNMHSHGTSVLSCMAAYVSGQMIGTAPKANYWLIRTEVGESEKIIEEYYWVSGAEFADSIGADLINSSLGYTTFDDPSTNHKYSDMDGNTTFVTKGADKAAQKGILVVNSAGNEGSSAWKYIGAPADGDSVFSIGAVNSNGDRASFSSLGPTFDRRIKPTVAGQGSGSALYYPYGFGSGSGTSFSSPIICGMTACFWQAFPALNNMQIIESIKSMASQFSRPDSLLGWGIPNYQASFTTLLSVHNQTVTKELIAYPNPVREKLTIGFPVSLSGKYTLDIYNLQGKPVYSVQKNEGSVRSIQVNDLSSFPAGIYLVKVTNGINIYSGRIIKM